MTRSHSVRQLTLKATYKFRFLYLSEVAICVLGESVRENEGEVNGTFQLFGEYCRVRKTSLLNDV